MINSPDNQPLTPEHVAQATPDKEETSLESPYDVLDVNPDDSWETIQRAYNERIAPFKMTPARPIFGITEARDLASEQEKIVAAFEQLQEQRTDRAEYLKEAKDLPSLLRRLDMLMETGSSFLKNENGSLYSVSEAQFQVTDILRTMFSVTDARISPRQFNALSDEHGVRTVFERDLPIFQQAIKRMQVAENFSAIEYGMVMIQRLGYEKLPIWDTDNKPAFIYLKDELETIESLKRNIGKRKVYERAVVTVYKKDIGIRVLSAGIEPTSEVPETPVLSVEL